MWTLLAQLLLVVALTVIVAALSWRKQRPPDDGIDNLSIPKAEEGLEIPKVFGTVTIKSPQVAWYGHKRSRKIQVKGGRKYGLFGPRSKTTVGFRYFLGIHFVVCLGTIDRLRRISYDGRTAWLGSSPGGRFFISKPTLFGKRDREGGIEGFFTLRSGSPIQQTIPYLVSQLGSPQPAYRGVMSVVFEQMYIGNQPNVRPIAIRVSRIFTAHQGLNFGVQWYSEKAAIFQRTATDVNELHRIHISIDVSSTMTGQRIENAKAAIIQLLQFLRDQGQRSSIRIVTWSSSIQQSITRNNITTSGYNDLINFVQTIPTPSGGTNFGAPFVDANSFFGNNLSDSRRMLFITDGQPSPVNNLVTAQEVYNSFQNVEVIGISAATLTDELISVVDKGTQLHSGNLNVLSNFFSLPYDEFDMNPAHILREIILSPDTGGSGNFSDAGSTWIEAADTLYDEEFGISDVWGNPSNRSAFKERIERHIDARVYQDRRTGLWEIKLIRNDYDPDELHVFDSSNVIAWEDLNFPEIYNLPNQITVTFTDPNRDEPGSITLTDPARVLGVGRVINDKIEYSGIQKMSLASRVAMRDLLARSSPLITGTIVVTGLPLDLNLGSVIKLNYPRLSIINRIVRILEIDEGDGRNNSIRVRFVEDRFSLGDDQGDGIEFITPEPPAVAEEVNPRVVEEATYVSALLSLGEIEFSNALEIDSSLGLLHVTGGNLNGGISGIFNVEIDGTYEDIVEQELTPSGELLTPLTDRPDETEVFVSGFNLLDMASGSILAIGEEIVRLVSIEENPNWTAVGNPPEGEFFLLVLDRGCIDTVPHSHEVGATFVQWLENGVIEEPFTASDDVGVKIQTITLDEVLDIGLAPEDRVIFNSRILRPYPPGNLKINNLYEEEGWTGSSTLSWAHRDRVAQAETIVPYISASVGPETGVTYSVRVTAVDQSGSLIVELYSTSGLTGTSVTIDSVDFTEPLPAECDKIIWEVWSVRDEIESWQRASVETVITLKAPTNLSTQVIFS